MRVAAVALVLVVGAAVVLWFGNSLNSWVLGGLIGGLAALLLSIPISLTLFSFLSRRTDERVDSRAQEHVSLSRSYDYAEAPAPVYEAEAYVELSEDEVVGYEALRPRRNEVRKLTAPSYPRLPAPGEGEVSHMANAPHQQNAMNYPQATRQQPQRVPQRAKGNSTERFIAERRVNHSSFLGYQANSYRAQQHHTAALHTARKEAALRQEGRDIEVLPTASSKRLPAVRTNQSLIAQQYGTKVQRSSRQLPPQSANQTKSSRVVEGKVSQRVNNSRGLPAGGESLAHHTPETDAIRVGDLQTDRLHNLFPETGALRQQMQTGPMKQRAQQMQTGQIARNPQIGEQRRNPDTITGSLKNPLVRRAPYMYEDDPLRQELAQQIDHPIARRRSSRFEDPDEDI